MNPLTGAWELALTSFFTTEEVKFLLIPSVLSGNVYLKTVPTEKHEN